MSGSSLVWTTDRQGTIGTGTSFETIDLSPGSHAITLTATDKDGLSVATSVSIVVQPDSTPGSVAGSVVRTNDQTGLASIRMLLIKDSDTATAHSDAAGMFEFPEVVRGDYVVAPRREDLPLFGAFTTSERLHVSVRPRQNVTGLRIGFQVAEVVVQTLLNPSSISIGGVATVSLQLVLSDVTLPVGGIAGSVAWDPSRATLIAGSASGSPWTGAFLVNDAERGEVRFVGVAATGINGETIVSITFDITGVSPGTVEFDPNVTDLAVVEEQTGEGMSLLDAALVTESKGVLTIR